MSKTQNIAAQESMLLENSAKHISNICFNIKAGHTMDVSGHSICRTVSNSTCSNDSNFQKYIWQSYIAKYP